MGSLSAASSSFLCSLKSQLFQHRFLSFAKVEVRVNQIQTGKAEADNKTKELNETKKNRQMRYLE